MTQTPKENTDPLPIYMSLVLPVAAVLVSAAFIVPLFSGATSTDSFVSSGNLSSGNVQNLRILKPNNGNSLTAIGGASIAVVDNALIGTRSVLDSQEDAYVELTGHSTNVYVVRQGDTISQIAESFGVSQNTISWANKLAGAKIKVGQELIILPVSGVLHTIVKGETLSSIAKKYEGDVDEIINYNRLAIGEALEIGFEITIPGGKVKTVSTPTIKKATQIITTRTSSGLIETNASGVTTWRNGVRTTPLRGTGGPVYTGYYIRPINGFGKSRGLHGFNAVDFAAPSGTPILASASGRVIIAKHGGWNGGYGKYVAIEHPNGTQTLYAHQSNVIVNAGQNVVQGQVIGYVGTTGNSSGNHLHFEVRGAQNPY